MSVVIAGKGGMENGSENGREIKNLSSRNCSAVIYTPCMDIASCYFN